MHSLGNGMAPASAPESDRMGEDQVRHQASGQRGGICVPSKGMGGFTGVLEGQRRPIVSDVRERGGYRSAHITKKFWWEFLSPHIR